MSLTRRLFLSGLGAAASSCAAASSEPLHAKLGIDSYTLRGFGWKAFEMLDYAAGMGLDVVQFSELPHLGTYEQAQEEGYLRRVKAHADRLGVRLEMGTWGVCPTNPRSQKNFENYGPPDEQLRIAIRIAKILGAKTVRCVMGSGNLRREDGPLDKHMDAMIRLFKSVREDALRAGVHLAPENHKDMRASEMLWMIQQAGIDYVGATVDTGNPMEVLEDPMETVETLAPVAVSSHFRDSALFAHPRGAAFQWTAMGDGSIRIGDVVRRFVQLCPAVPVILEIITGRAPKVLAYREDGFMEAFPDLSPDALARFEKLAARGHPLMAGMMIPDNAAQHPAFLEAVKQQQRVDFERSVHYLRETVGLRSPGR